MNDVVVLGKVSQETMGSSGASRDPVSEGGVFKCSVPSKPLSGQQCGIG